MQSPPTPLELDVSSLKRFLVTAMVELTAAEQTLNSLNVYPVPDGDTGSNVRSTWQAFFEAAPTEGTGGEPEPDEVAIREGLRRLTMGARGNAGVILSEYVRGCCSLLRFDEGCLRPIDGDRMVRMLHSGAHAARRAVDQPVEGTVLSVADAAAAGAVQVRSRIARAGEVASPAQVLQGAVTSATEALKRSPQQLPLLAQAGVVDAGGAALLFLLEALARVAGGRHGLPRAKDHAWLEVAHNRGFAKDQVCQVSDVGPGFELMGLAEGLSEDEATQLRSALSTCGDSVVVAGGDGVHRVHVHTDDVLRAASIVRCRAALSAPSVTRFAGPLDTLGRIAVDVADDVLAQFASACGFSSVHGPSADGCEYRVSDGVNTSAGDARAVTILGESTTVHAIATLEACLFEATLDDDVDVEAVARDAAFLQVQGAHSWVQARDVVRSCAGEAEHLVVLIDPSADAAESSAFEEFVASHEAEVVVLRVVCGALVQIGFE